MIIQSFHSHSQLCSGHTGCFSSKCQFVVLEPLHVTSLYGKLLAPSSGLVFGLVWQTRKDCSDYSFSTVFPISVFSLTWLFSLPQCVVIQVFINVLMSIMSMRPQNQRRQNTGSFLLLLFILYFRSESPAYEVKQCLFNFNVHMYFLEFNFQLY